MKLQEEEKQKQTMGLGDRKDSDPDGKEVLVPQMMSGPGGMGVKKRRLQWYE